MNGMEWNGISYLGKSLMAARFLRKRKFFFCGKELKDIFFVYYENVCSHFLLFRAEGVKCLQINTLFTNQFSSQKY